MKKELLSIVIPCKNEEKYIANTLNALLMQPAVTFETPILIADAGSTDKTREIIDRYRAFLNIKVVPGGLPAKGRNIGASYTNSEFILFMDADITPGEPNTILEALNLARARNLDLVSTHIHSTNGNFADNFLWHLHGLASMTKIAGAYAAGMFILMRSSAFYRLGGFNEQIALGEDWDLTHRIDPDKFSISKSYINTTNRRFAAQGYLKTFLQYFMVAASSSYRQRDHKKYFDVKFN